MRHFLHAPLLADLQAILQIVHDELVHANKKFMSYDHYAGQKVLKVDNTIKVKLEPKYFRPSQILQVESNRMVISICGMVFLNG